MCLYILYVSSHKKYNNLLIEIRCISVQLEKKTEINLARIVDPLSETRTLILYMTQNAFSELLYVHVKKCY